MSRQVRPIAQEYRNRDYVLGQLDEGVFDAINKGGDDGRFLFTTGCLDALDCLPAGSMRKLTDAYHDQSQVWRGRTLADELAFEALMEELAEENQ